MNINQKLELVGCFVLFSAFAFVFVFLYLVKLLAGVYIYTRKHIKKEKVKYLIY